MFVVKKKTIIAYVCVLLACVAGVSCAAVFCSRAATAGSSIVVVLDAGHGGVDAGAVGVAGTHESDLNLSVAKILERKLTASGISVVMTRSNSDGLYGMPTNGFKRRDMAKRREIIEQAIPLFVISVHMNISNVPSVTGAQVFYNKTSESSKKLAEGLQKSLNNGMGYKRHRTELAGDYFMLNCTKFTSVIVECGFLSNAAEEQKLKDAAYQERLAMCIAQGALAYMTEITYKPEC